MGKFSAGYSAGMTKTDESLLPEDSQNPEFMAGYFLARAYDNWEEARQVCLRLFEELQQKSTREVNEMTHKKSVGRSRGHRV